MWYEAHHLAQPLGKAHLNPQHTLAQRSCTHESWVMTASSAYSTVALGVTYRSTGTASLQGKILAYRSMSTASLQRKCRIPHRSRGETPPDMIRPLIKDNMVVYWICESLLNRPILQSFFFSHVILQDTP